MSTDDTTVNDSITQADALQQAVSEAMERPEGDREAALSEVVTKANALKSTLSRHLGGAGEASRPSLVRAIAHLGAIIEHGKHGANPDEAHTEERMQSLTEASGDALSHTSSAVDKIR